MKKFEKLIIISDMDGTFFGENATILQNNLDAIRYFHDNGGLFSLATGRDFKILEHMYPELKDYLSCYAILSNGSYLYDFQKKQMLCEIELDKEEVLKTLDYIKSKVPEATYRISFEKGFLCDKNNKIPFSESLKEKLSEILIVDDPLNYLNLPWHKLVFSANGEKGASSDGLALPQNNWISKVEELVNKMNFVNLSFTTSSETLLEILPKESSKGKALKKLKTLFPDRKTICVGDYRNDLDLLQSADIPACPANALDEIKSISKIHLCHHREGCIADLIYKLDSIV